MNRTVSPVDLGIDIGSTTVKIVVMDREDRVVDTLYRYHQGNPFQVVQEYLNASEWEVFRSVAATTGTPYFIHADQRFDSKVCFIEGVRYIHKDIRNLIIVGSEKFARIIFNAQGAYRKMRANSTCAAGTGSFLDQQAARLGIGTSDKLDALARGAKADIPRIASRCSVFAKTDLIHAQQEGWGLAEISDGLCLGLARNIADTLFPGETLESPTVMAGGVALNRRVVEHLEKIAGTPIITDEMSPFYGAIGAILRLRLLDTQTSKSSTAGEDKRKGVGIGPSKGYRTEGHRAEELLVKIEEKKRYAHAPLRGPQGPYPEFTSKESFNHVSQTLGPQNPVETDIYETLPKGIPLEVLLGIDIGSTSTKAAVLSTQGRMLLGLYTRTAGDPIRAVQGLLETLQFIEQREDIRFSIRSCATTGSGRKLVGAVIGADGVIDEITAHARAAIELDRNVDTIIEIGGQDSKFTVLSEGRVVFSQMNTVCAAGTGSFIEEQALKLGVPIRQYADRALGHRAPATSDRCTVFMERDLNNLQNEGYSTEELLTATLFSVCDNYLSKVAMEGSIGDHIVFQGATAKNKALVAAFEKRLGKPIAVSPFCHLTGAMGAVLQHRDDDREAVSAAEEISGKEAIRPSSFKGLDIWRETITQRSDVCTGCTNHCKLHIITLQGQEVVYGYLCGRGAGDTTFVSKNRSGFDLLRERNFLLNESIRSVREKAVLKPSADGPLGARLSQAMVSLSTQTINMLTDAVYQAADRALEAVTPPATNRSPQTSPVEAPAPSYPKIGIPRALYLQEDAFFWKAFFEKLGFTVQLGNDAADQLISGKRIAGADFCAPISMIHGQVQQLLQSCDYVFLPVYLEAPLRGKDEPTKAGQERNLFCNYSQYAPTIVGVATNGADRLLRPLIYSTYGDDSSAMNEIREALRPLCAARGIPLPSPSVMERTYRLMRRAKHLYNQKLRELFAKVKPDADEPAILLTGRPYTVLSKGLNKGIVDLFAQYGLKTLFHDMITPLESYKQEHELQAYHWYYASQVIETAYFSRDNPNYYPVLITSFKCGPDSFAIESFKDILERAHKPYLILQIDEHGSAVGYETRVEAAVRAFRNHFYAKPKILGATAHTSSSSATAGEGPKNEKNGRPMENGGEPTRKNGPIFPLSLLGTGSKETTKETPKPKQASQFPRTKTVLLPNWDPLVCDLLSAALRGHGIDAHALEESPEMIREAMTLNTGQCIPVSIIAYEAIKYVETKGLDPAQTTLWMVRALWPCNIPLYPLQIENIFKKAGGGMENMQVYNGDMIFFDVSPRMTIDAFYAFALGGMLRKIITRIRPYELEPGSADAYVAEALKKCVEAFEKRRPMVPVIKKIAEGLENLRRREEKRPKVAIFGDFYVRDNDIFNQNLIRSIEQAGGEVVVTSYIEYLKATVDSFFDRLLLEKRYASWAGYRTVLMAIAQVERSLARKTGMALGTTWDNKRRKEAYEYFGIRPEMSGENFDNTLKILKILDEYPDVSLFVQAAPAFCCASLVTESMEKAIENLTGVPVLSITYDGTGALKNDLVEPYLAAFQPKG